jgi:hypothetical protein
MFGDVLIQPQPGKHMFISQSAGISGELYTFSVLGRSKHKSWKLKLTTLSQSDEVLIQRFASCKRQTMKQRAKKSGEKIRLKDLPDSWFQSKTRVCFWLVFTTTFPGVSKILYDHISIVFCRLLLPNTHFGSCLLQRTSVISDKLSEEMSNDLSLSMSWLIFQNMCQMTCQYICQMSIHSFNYSRFPIPSI